MSNVTSVSDVLSLLSVGTSSPHDHLRCGGDAVLIKYFEQQGSDTDRGVGVENVLFSDQVIKVNKRGKQQKRDFIITNYAIYNFEPKSYKKAKRAVAITSLSSLIIHDQSGEMLIKVRGDYDYRLIVVRSADVVQLLLRLFAEQTGSSLPVDVTTNDLSSLQVLKEDVGKKRGSLQPLSPRNPSNMLFSAGGAGLGGRRESGSAIENFNSISSLSSLPSPSSPSSSSAPPSDDSENLTSKPSREGWCSKRGDVNSQWRRRYFRLNEHNLLYYEPRLKETIVIERGGVRVWANRRLAPDATEHLQQGPKQMESILKEPERARAFLAWTQANGFLGTDSVEMFLAIDFFKEQAGAFPHQMEGLARKVYESFLAPGSRKDLSFLPLEVREGVHDAMLQSSSTYSLSMFNSVQSHLLSFLQTNLLPSYLSHSFQRYQNTEHFSLKQELTEADKKKPECVNCLSSFTGFSLFNKRRFCRYCGEVMCALCVDRAVALPPEFNQKEPVRVCDQCLAVLLYGNQPHAFSYVNKNRRPVNLAAPSADEMQRWTAAFKHVVVASEPDSCGVHQEGWMMWEVGEKRVWRRAYVVLDNNKLYFYELKLKKSVAMGEGAGIHASTEIKPTLSLEEANREGLRSLSGFAYRFNISYRERLYAFAADTEEDMGEWIEALNNCVKRSRGGAGRRGADALSLDHLSDAFYEEAPTGEVSFVFTDVQSSTKLWEQVPLAMDEGLKKHDALLRQLLRVFRGYEVKTEGDAFMVVFGSAVDAIRWCLAVQKALMTEIQWAEELLRHPAAAVVYPSSSSSSSSSDAPIWNGIRIRMGIHVGCPACRKNPVTGRMDYFGPVVNRSARVADSAHGGQVICTEEVYGKLLEAQERGEVKGTVLVEELGSFKYKGISEMVKVYQLYTEELAGRNPFPALRTKEEGGGAAEEKERSPSSLSTASSASSSSPHGDRDVSTSSSSTSAFRHSPSSYSQPNRLAANSISYSSNSQAEGYGGEGGGGGARNCPRQGERGHFPPVPPILQFGADGGGRGGSGLSARLPEDSEGGKQRSKRRAAISEKQ